MSHTSKINAIAITSVTALRAAINELNASGVRCALLERATPRAFYKNQEGLGLADYVVRLDDAAYDIGLYKQPDGTYEARTDFFNRSVENVLGCKAGDPSRTEQAKMGKLFQMYGIHAATEAARKKGHSVSRVLGENGTIKLEITGTTL